MRSLSDSRQIASVLSTLAWKLRFRSYFLLKALGPSDWVKSGFSSTLVRKMKAASRELALVPEGRLRWLSPLLIKQSVIFPKSDFQYSFQELKSPASSDPEVAMAAHRFHWIYALLADGNFKTALSSIEHWIGSGAWIEAPEAKEAYTISERLIAWIAFRISSRASNEPLPCDQVDSSILEQTRHLILHLELHGFLTNNHILNNARALYWVGCAYGLSTLRELSLELFAAFLPRLLHDGTFIEQSSHYQVLLTRTIAEAYWLAVIHEDRKLSALLKQPVAQALAMSRNLFEGVRSDFPVVGDISPDSPPAFLLGYPLTEASSGRSSPWYSVFSPILGSFPAEILHAAKERELVSSEIRRFRLLNGRVDLWVSCKKGLRRHGHNDNGSIVLLVDGQLWIADPGLASYSLKFDRGDSPSGAFFHNSPLINGHGADVSGSKWFSAEQVPSKAEILSFDDRHVEIKVRYFNGSVVHRRIEAISVSEIGVQDRLDTPQPVSYRSAWTLSSLIEVIHESARATTIDTASRYGETTQKNHVVVELRNEASSEVSIQFRAVK